MRPAIRCQVPGTHRLPPVRGMALAAGLAVALVPGLTLASSAQAAPRHLSFAHPRAPRVGPAPASVMAAMFSSADPYSPLRGHGYRYGVIPSRARLTEMRQWAIAHPRVPAAPSSDLAYGGGVDGIGVTTGPEKVYLVFYGAQWGATGTNSQGDVTLSGDPNGAAPYLQNLFKGLGTGNELWSGVMTQYCDGVATGAKSCPVSSNKHVAYPKGGALAGVWADESAASPSSATGHQLGAEAVKAAGHFGNTTAASNRDAQYVILSPTGADPDKYQQNGFCAWHDFNGDPTLSGGAVTSPYGDIAFTNMPYVTDVGASCGENFVNSGSAGLLDGFSIVNGHEYAETITDQNPPGGWLNPSGEETGDLCAWNEGPGAPAADLSLTTGTFAMQSTWANDGNGTCEFSHAIVGNGSGNIVTVTNPGSQVDRVGAAVRLQMNATDSQSGQALTWSASGLPRGLSISSSSGLISGTLTTAGTSNVTVTATDTTKAPGSVSFAWEVGLRGGGIVNGGFETGTFSGWLTSGPHTAIVSSGQHSGKHAAMAGNTTATNGNSSIAQTFVVPSGKHTLTFWYDVSCPGTVQDEWATVTLRDKTARTTRTPLRRTCAFFSGWKKVTVSVTARHTYTLTLTNHDDNNPIYPTYTLYDSVTLS